MRSARRTTHSGHWVLWVLWGVLVPGGYAAQDAADGAEFARRVAEFSAADQELGRTAAELARMSGSLDALLSMEAAGRVPAADGSWTFLSADQLRLLARAAEEFEPHGVVLHVRGGLAESPSVPWRRAALRLLGLHVSTTDLSLLGEVAVVERGGGAEPELLEPFREALSSVLRRLGHDVTALDWLAAEAESLTEQVLRAVGGAGDPDGLLWLAAWLKDPRLGPIALQELGRLAPRAPAELAAEVSVYVRPLLSSKDPIPRRGAIGALGALRDPASIPALAGRLEPGVPAGERRMAHSALRKISGLNLPPAAEAWLGWFDQEKRWFLGAWEPTIESLASQDEAEVVAAVRQLSNHPIIRDRVAAKLAPLVLRHPSPTVRGQVCLGLARTGSGEALHALVAALEDEDPDVRLVALSALEEMTGLSLPLDATAWSEALELGL